MILSSDAFDAITTALADVPSIFSTGYTSRRAASCGDRPNHFYMLGSMGLASSIGMGVALSRKDRRVCVIDGDASFLMNVSSSLMLKSLSLPNIQHILIDNGINGSTGGQPSLSRRTDICGLARSLGYEIVLTSSSIEGLKESLDVLSRVRSRPAFLHCLTVDDAPPGGRIGVPPPRIAERFTRWLTT
jgi:thiamine pyrophosphate-dependent acetolactate synthase large subunit-like protein